MLTLTKTLAVLGGIAAFVPAVQAATLYDNGPVVNANGKSILLRPSTDYGFGDQTSLSDAVADDFTVGAGQTWNVDMLSFYGYQTGAGAFTFTDATWSIVMGDVNTGTVVASGVTAVTDGGLMGYRVTGRTRTNTDRAIFEVDAAVSGVTLGEGTYWLRWSLTGSDSFSGPWQPPLSNRAPGNAYQSVGGADFNPLVDEGSGAPIALPFTISGDVVAVPEPDTWALMLLGGLAVAGWARRRRA